MLVNFLQPFFCGCRRGSLLRVGGSVSIENYHGASVELAIMMGKRSVRAIALVLILVAGCAALLGWDLVYEQQITDRFVEPPSGLDKM